MQPAPWNDGPSGQLRSQSENGPRAEPGMSGWIEWLRGDDLVPEPYRDGSQTYTADLTAPGGGGGGGAFGLSRSLSAPLGSGGSFSGVLSGGAAALSKGLRGLSGLLGSGSGSGKGGSTGGGGGLDGLPQTVGQARVMEAREAERAATAARGRDPIDNCL